MKIIGCQGDTASSARCSAAPGTGGEANGQGWSAVKIAPTMKQKGDRSGRIDRAIDQGEPAFIRRLLRASQGRGWINTTFIERLNAAFCSRLAGLVRDGRGLLQLPGPLEAWMGLVGMVYNWATYHQSLVIVLPVSERKRFWLKRIPANPLEKLSVLFVKLTSNAV